MKTTIKILALFIIAVSLFSCSAKHEVTRVAYDEQIDLSGRWNDTDSWRTAQDITNQILNDRWIRDFNDDNGGERPKVIVGLMKNKSHEHINAETFVKDIEKSFIRTGTIRLIQGGEKREELRYERQDQQDYSSPATMKKWGRELGADFMLHGTINSIVDTYSKQKVLYYQIDLELTNLETNEVVWIGDEKIKKYVKN